MTNPKRPAVSTSGATSPKLRPRPRPKYLTAPTTDLDAMAQRRTLMVLSVLSGERPVTEVIAEAQISRGTYYDLEERAVRAMLAALLPQTGASPSGGGEKQRIASLEQKVAKLEQDKRRAERLLYLTRQVLKPRPVTTTAGRPAKAKRRPSAGGGKLSSPGSAGTKPAAPAPASASPPTPAGAGER